MPRSVVLETLTRLWAALEPLQLPMALLGGLALSFWKHVRATQDVDVVVGVKQNMIDDLLGSLVQAGFRPRSSIPVVSLGNMRVLQMEYEPEDAFIAVRVDLLLVNSDYHEVALARRVPVRLPSTETDLKVLSCEDLILHKLVAGRLIDIADTAALLRLNRETLDLNYLIGWARLLHQEHDLSKAWREVFPGEVFPP